ncbi:immobilization antigen (macronuclear) [Tetrahymena thermophila SB210]|uniref:Immobilization antigen n=1 Tax=Tetrahymena thermophila (strain SB210) TaxID=312017 RepID=Q23JS0_TETTS|nr:immobilization antigen [Tetrahymena thermophila SB210]EAR96790.1 immobilization antigen [Tetrahymena thermophila SB210]|eukprot:XP_001017035.1 immobilization antigen [Tetrahymena thermophila SB210]
MKKQFIILALLGIFALAQQECPENSFLKSEKCYCKEGYYGVSADKCVQCPDNTNSTPGYYNTRPDSTVADCNTCQYNYYVTVKGTKQSPATCTQCPEHSMTTYATRGINVTTEDKACLECEDGYYWNNKDGKKVCLPCGSEGAAPLDKQTAGKDASFCKMCKEGYFMTKAADPVTGQAAQCSKCPEKSGSGPQREVGSIANCGCIDSLADKLSDTVQSCVCKAGYTGQASNDRYKSGCEPACADNASKYDGRCACNKGYYGKSANYGDICEKCPELTTSNQCHGCNTGEKANLNSCYQCIENYYVSEVAGETSSNQHAATCKPCPENSYNKEGAMGSCQCFDQFAEKLNYSSTKCECKYGYTGNPATKKGEIGCVKKGSSSSGSSGSNSNSGSQGNSSNTNSGSSGNSSNTNSGSSGNSSNTNSGSSGSNENSEKKDKETSESQSINVSTNSANLKILALMMLLAILI